MNKEQNSFRRHLEYASAEVASWPAWKRSIAIPAQLEKAPEPAGFQVRSFYTKNEWTGHHKFETTQEVEESNGEWRYVYTSLPEVAELQKNFQAAIEFEKNASKADRILLLKYKKQVQDLIAQNTDYLERLRDVRGHYEAAGKATEQAHVALAESQHKVTYLEKQFHALQAEVERFRNPPSSATVAIELEIDKQLIASAMDPGRMFRQDGIHVYEAFLEAMDKDKSCSKQ